MHHNFGHGQGDTPAPSVVRSFTLTGGRATPVVDLGFEAVVRVQSSGRHRMWPVGPKAEIVAVCDGKSVAEVSAAVKRPIGVVRVLLGDLVSEGHLAVERTITASTSVDDRRELLERTLRGLRTTG
ncbi:DUF742 domain-containing protein [Nocardioides yefusunii]|uniref:DUF742 domain-containing protein n=1 Tax=Nocardioides yefusunii TaxID=2500546 RepID=A0ABW1R294_9ACTN|nr:DUF742 domain-containing protein [Nocardioides yefusunii]